MFASRTIDRPRMLADELARTAPDLPAEIQARAVDAVRGTSVPASRLVLLCLDLLDDQLRAVERGRHNTALSIQTTRRALMRLSKEIKA